MAGYLHFWGWFFVITTVLIALFKHETNFQPAGEEMFAAWLLGSSILRQARECLAHIAVLCDALQQSASHFESDTDPTEKLLT